MSFKTVMATVLHASALGIMAWGYNNLEKTVLHSFIQGQTGGHSQFLTIQALLISSATMAISLGYDLSSWTFLKQAKRAFFMIALPLSVVVSSIYWTLLLFFPTLILQPIPGAEHSEPSSSEEAAPIARIPLSLDLALHAVPASSLLLDFFLFERSYGKKAASWGATAMSVAFCIWYSSWVEYCAAKNNGWFPYPFLTVNEFPGRVAIYIVVTSIAFLSFQGINNMHARITGRVPKGKEKAH